jgi:16S rRNA (guanine(1405)-N(7))-methyltransferase
MGRLDATSTGQLGDGPVRQVQAALAASRRYAGVAPATVSRVARKALLASRGDVPEAIKRTKRGLHEIYGAYLPARQADYPGLLGKLQAAASGGDRQAVRQVLRAAMAIHASTRERLPYLEAFYDEIFSRVPAPATVRDLACGLNPLAAPWMPLPAAVTYQASDIDGRLIQFVGSALGVLGFTGGAEVVDLIEEPATQRADLTLLLKTLPCLERQQAGAGWALLDAIDSPVLVVTFPTKSLGQRSKGMFQTYSATFEAYLSGRPWRAEQAEIRGELIYVVRKGG